MCEFALRGEMEADESTFTTEFDMAKTLGVEDKARLDRYVCAAVTGLLAKGVRSEVVARVAWDVALQIEAQRAKTHEKYLND